jgi:hypothetical protein
MPRLLVFGLSSRRLWTSPRLIHLRYVVDEVEMRYIFLYFSYSFFPLSVSFHQYTVFVQPLVHSFTHSFVYNRC